MRRARIASTAVIQRRTRTTSRPNVFSRGPYPANLITVPSCKTCNRRFGRDDEYFRDSLALSTFERADPPELQHIHDAMRRSLRHREFRPPARQFLERSRDAWAVLNSAVVLERV